MIIYCTRPGGCRPHAFQDARYGDGVRVHNKAVDKGSPVPIWRCTVCEHERRAQT